MSDESSIVREAPTQAWWHPNRLFIGSKAIWAIMLVLMSISLWTVSYTHLTLPTTPYV